MCLECFNVIHFSEYKFGFKDNQPLIKHVKSLSIYPDDTLFLISMKIPVVQSLDQNFVSAQCVFQV